MLSFLGILKSPTTWKAVVILVLVAFIGAKYISLTTTIKNLQGDKLSLEEDLRDCERNFNTEKIANIQNRQTIEKYKADLEVQNKSIKEKELSLDSLNNIIEDIKKNPPSTKVIVKEPKPAECSKYTKFKGMKYEDL